MVLPGKQRNQYLDILKSFACVMVVYVHSGNLFGYAQFPNLVPALSKLAQCGVLIFFTISGYFAISMENQPYLEMIKKKISSLLIPFIIWNLIYLIFEYAGYFILPSAFVDISRWTFRELLVNVFGIPFMKSPLYVPLWFVRELFVLFLFCPVIILCIKRLPMVILIPLFVAIIIGKMPFLYNNGYFLKTAVPFFAVGLWIGFNRKLVKLYVKKESLIITAIAAILLIYMQESYHGSYVVSSVFSWLATFLLFPIILSFGQYVLKNKKVLNIFLLVSRHSFMIFVLHGKLLALLQIVCTRTIRQNSRILFAEYIVQPIIVILISVWISLLLSKKTPKLYCFLTGGRIKANA